MMAWLLLLRMLGLLNLLILARVVVSWVAPTSRHPLVEFIRRVTDPLLRPLQALIPATSGLDFTPMVALLIIWAARRVIERYVLYPGF